MTDKKSSTQTLGVEGVATVPVLAAQTAAGPVALPVIPRAEAKGASHASHAFTALYREHFAYVWRSLRRLGVREADLADLAHDVFVVVHRKLADFDPSRPAKPWLFGICFRIALDKKRKHSSWKESLVDSTDEEAVAREPLPDATVEAREAHDLVMRALDALDIDKRAVFVLHELEGSSMPEIAAVIDAPLNTLYSRLRLAREAFVAEVRRLQQVRP